MAATTAMTRFIEKPYDVYLEGSRLCVLHRVSFCKYVKQLDEKFYDSLTGHDIFTPSRAPKIVQGLIPDESKCLRMTDSCVGESDDPVSLRHETDTVMVVTLRWKYPLPIEGEFDRDAIHIACVLIEEKDEVRTIRALQNEVASLTERLVESDKVIRRLEIHRMYSETVAMFGPEAIPPPLYHFALQVFAAEFDGKPYIFPIIGPNSINGVKVGPWDGLWTGPYWLRSVVCILPMAFPVWHRLEEIRCRRLIVSNEERTPASGYGTSSTGGTAERAEKSIISLWHENRYDNLHVRYVYSHENPLPDSILHRSTTSVTLHPAVQSVIFAKHDVGTTLVACRKMNETTKTIILPTAAKGEIVGAKIMTNARFSDTTERCLESPLSWEAEDLQAEIATANASVKDLHVPTF